MFFRYIGRFTWRKASAHNAPYCTNLQYSGHGFAKWIPSYPRITLPLKTALSIMKNRSNHPRKKFKLQWTSRQISGIKKPGGFSLPGFSEFLLYSGRLFCLPEYPADLAHNALHQGDCPRAAHVTEGHGHGVVVNQILSHWFGLCWLNFVSGRIIPPLPEK